METLTPERWKEISPYLDEALSLSMDQQGAWLNSLRAENPGIATLLEELLVSHRAAAKKHAVPAA